MEQQDDKLQRLENYISRIENKENKIYFFLPSVPQASGGIGVVYEHVKTLNNLGYKAFVIYESTKENPYIKPEWLGVEYTELPHLDTSKIGEVGPDDLLIIPEGLSDVMEKYKNLPCLRIVLCQSYLYVLGALIPGMSWLNFGIKDVIAVTPTLQDYLENTFGKGTLDIKLCRPSIDENQFKPSVKPKKPIIAISSRDRSMTTTIVKQFYAQYPEYRWINFKEMVGMSREVFAETLEECFLGIWMDRVAGFGTFPIECAKSNVPFIGLVPDIIPEYAADNEGIWTNTFLQIPKLVSEYTKLWLEDKEPQEILDGIKKLSTLYTKEDEVKNIQELYEGYISRRKDEINEVIRKIKTEENE